MRSFLLSVFVLIAISAWAQAPDPQILAQINKIKAIDNHSHPPRLVAPGEKDDQFDALPCDPLEPSALPTMMRPENPRFLAAWKALYGYKYDDMTPDHVRELMEAKKRVMSQQGDHFLVWVLDQLGIESELANRVAMGRGLEVPRFRWVPFDDALLLPLNNQNLANESPDRKFFYSCEEMLLKRYLHDLGLSAPPATLQQYTARVITPTLEHQKKNGAVAVKFEAAYLRSLNFENASADDAGKIYSQYIKGSVPASAEYLKLQDYLFRYLAREAGRLGLPVHIHTGGGCGTYFRLAGSNPVLLESVLDDPTLRKTNFVLLHGGAGPFTKQVAYLLIKPNVYTDFSEQTWLLSTRKLSEVIRDWLEWFPEKVMFGTDLFPNTPEINWEEIGWMTSTNGREALAIALTGMIEDKEITRERALELAHMVLHDNAAKLYGWQK
ncbi:MAG TPA: amidohydrolase family protein [Terriglobales bacterium]